MGKAAGRGKSRKQRRKSLTKKDRQASHFQTARIGGYEESQIICYLWDVVRDVEEAEAGRSSGTDMEKLKELKRQMRRRIRVEMRRYFARRNRIIMKNVVSLAAMLFGIVWLFGFLIGVDRVSGNSMYPNLQDGDWIVYSRVHVGEKLQRDEVVVFEKNGESLVKRITGLPGDTVEISASGSQVVVNGVPVRENYVTLSNPVSRDEEEGTENRGGATTKVMDRQYLVLGDNRSISVDSRDRTIGTVPEENVLGNVVFIIRRDGRKYEMSGDTKEYWRKNYEPF